MDQLQAGDLLAAICDPIAADVALVPFPAVIGVAAPPLEAVAVTLLNAVELLGL